MKKIKFEEIVLAALLHDVGKSMQRGGEKEHEYSDKDIALFCPSSKKHGKEQRTHKHLLYSGKFAKIIFGKESIIETLCLGHHSPNTSYQKLIHVADGLAASERFKFKNEEALTEKCSSPEKTPLLSIFSLLNISPDEILEFWNELFWFPPGKDTEVLYPAPKNSTPCHYRYRIHDGEVKTGNEYLWKDFKNAAMVLKNKHQGKITLHTINEWEYLLKMYFSFIPSASPWDTQHFYLPDISLYFHSKLTAAIAGCLYKVLNNEEDMDSKLEEILSKKGIYYDNIFLLVGGDISGIQKFIYTLTSKGAAKTLRGRSVYLELLTRTAARYILRRFEFPDLNIIYEGGGRFYILLPGFVEKELKEISEDIEKKMFEIHQGELNVIVEGISFSPWAWVNTPEALWEQVNNQIRNRKRRKFHKVIKKYGVFEPQNAPLEVCEACKLREAEDEGKCKWCKSFETLGELVAEKNYLIEYRMKKEDMKEEKKKEDTPEIWAKSLEKFGIRYFFYSEEEVFGKSSRIRNGNYIYLLEKGKSMENKEDEDDYEKFLEKVLNLEKNVYAGYEFIAQVCPKNKNDKIKTFEEMAEASNGIKKLGILRMDVDDLGKKFREELGELATFSRIAQLSHSLSRFFKLYVPFKIENTEEYKNNLYLIYAGGDDLFLVGAWDKVVEVAYEIEKAIGGRKLEYMEHEYRDNDGFIKESVQRIAHYAGKRLKIKKVPFEKNGKDIKIDEININVVKSVTLSGGIGIFNPKFPIYKSAEIVGEMEEKAKGYKRENGREKDAICFLGTVMGWEEFEKVKEQKENLLELVENKKLSRSKLHFIVEMFELRERIKEAWKNKKEVNKEEMEKIINYERWKWRLTYGLLKDLGKEEDTRSRIEKFLKFVEEYPHLFAVPARWVELLTRKT